MKKKVFSVLLLALLLSQGLLPAAPALAAAPITPRVMAPAAGISTFPYTESFESGNGGWASGGTNSSWALGAPADDMIKSAADGTTAWKTGLATGYNPNESSYVISPAFDFSGLSDPVISLAVWWQTVPDGGSAGTNLQYSTDGGTSWTAVGVVDDPQNWYTSHETVYGLSWTGSAFGWFGRNDSGSNGWRTATHRLTGLSGQSSVYLRIAFGSDGYSPTDDGFAFDNVRIYDGAIKPGCAINTSPAGGMTDTLINTKLNWVGGSGGIPTGYRLYLGSDNPPTNVQNGYDSGSSVTYKPAVYLATHTTYYWQVVPYNSYGSPSGCPVSSFTTSDITLVGSFPYVQGFEDSETGGWASSGTNSSWAPGTPAGAVISGASSGSRAWVTGLTDGHNNNEKSYVFSPAFDFSDLAHPYVKFDLWWDAEAGLDGAQLQYSTDGGQTWIRAGQAGEDINWYNIDSVQGLDNTAGWGGSVAEDTANTSYNASRGWRTAMHDLEWLGGQPNVRLRFLFASNGSNRKDGFAFDNFEIRSGCSWIDNEMMTSDWHTAGNWNCGHVPGAADIVIIPGSTASPVIAADAAAAAVGLSQYNGLTLNSGNLETGYIYEGSPITTGANTTINLTGSGNAWESTRAANPGGLVSFNGPGIQRLVHDVNSPTLYRTQFYNLRVEANATLEAEGAFQITNNLTIMPGATLNMGPNDLNVGGLISNNGTLRQKQDVNGTAATAFFATGGYGGLLLDTHSQNLGATSVEIRGNQDCTNILNGTVRRCFSVTPTSLPASGVTLTFYFNASEIPTWMSCNELEVYQLDGTTWSDPLTRDTTYGVDGRNCTSAPYTIRVTGVTRALPFALKKAGAIPTPDKSTPANGASVQALAPTLSWTASPRASSYEYCYDTIDNDICDTNWISVETGGPILPSTLLTPAAAPTSASLPMLAGNTTYYWQVRAIYTGDTVLYANQGDWYAFTTSAYRIFLPVIKHY